MINCKMSKCLQSCQDCNTIQILCLQLLHCTTLYLQSSPVLTICDGRSLFVGATFREGASIGFDRNTALAKCQTQSALLPNSPSSVPPSYVLCLRTLLGTLSETTRTHVRAWSSNCASDRSMCGQYTVNHFNRLDSFYKSSVSVRAEDFAFYAVCSRGKEVLCM